MRRDCACPRAKHQHGTRGAYQKDRCRCLACRLGNARVAARGNVGQGWGDPGARLPRIGTIRRIQALHRIGWAETDLAERLGVSRQAIRDIRCHPSETIRASTAANITRLYDELWDQTPPAGATLTRTLNWATRQGWLPPMTWDDDRINDAMHKEFNSDRDTDIDETAVSEAIQGRKVRLTRPELTHAIDTMTGMGLSSSEIADRLGITQRTVVRTRRADSPIREYRKVVAA